MNNGVFDINAPLRMKSVRELTEQAYVKVEYQKSEVERDREILRLKFQNLGCSMTPEEEARSVLGREPNEEEVQLVQSLLNVR